MLKSTPVRILLAVIVIAVVAAAAMVVFDIDLLALMPEPGTAQTAPAPVVDAPAADTAADTVGA